MNSLDHFVPVGLAIVFGLGVCCFIALFERELVDILQSAFAVPLRIVLLAQESLGTFWKNTMSFNKTQVTEDGSLDLRSVVFRCIGAALYLWFFLIFTFADFHLLALTLTALGIDAGHFEPPFGAGTLTALSIIASILFWGTVFLDLMGTTSTAPWRELTGAWRKFLFGAVITCLTLALVVTASMGLYKGMVIAEESTTGAYTPPSAGGLTDLSLSASLENTTQPQTGQKESEVYYWVPVVANVGIPVLAFAGGVFSGWGLVMVIKFLMLGGILILVSPVGLALLGAVIVMNVVDRGCTFLLAVLAFLAAVGRRLLGLFGWNPKNPPPGGGGPGDGGPGGVGQAIPPEVDPGQERDPRTTGNPASGSGPEGDSEEKPSTCASDQDEKPDEPVKPSSKGWNPFDN